jgi:hypothetical protein
MVVLFFGGNMATKFWKCYAPGCLYRGATREFKRKIDPATKKLHTCDACRGEDHYCPKCHCLDVFPDRTFQCVGCGYTATQDIFFQLEEDTNWKNPDGGEYLGAIEKEENDIPLGPDPIRERWTYDCARNSRKMDTEKMSQRTFKKRIACTSKRFIQVS